MLFSLNFSLINMSFFFPIILFILFFMSLSSSRCECNYVIKQTFSLSFTFDISEVIIHLHITKLQLFFIWFSHTFYFYLSFFLLSNPKSCLLLFFLFLIFFFRCGWNIIRVWMKFYWYLKELIPYSFVFIFHVDKKSVYIRHHHISL